MTPLDYLTSAGRRADVVLPLTWYLIIASILTCVILGVLLILALLRSRTAGTRVPARVPPVRGENGTSWIVIGTALSAIPLIVALIWTMAALAATGSPPRRSAMTIDVTGRQWWWEVTYHGAQPSDVFTTANEIHIPTGVPVTVRLHGGDVIHSFWVPKLAGKTDTIPGQQNIAWLQADRPGRYRGQCAEYCGAQHAKMAFDVVAQPPADFERWRQAQLRSAAPPATAAQARGLALVTFRCGLCHAVRGTDAGAHAAPDLTHLMSRATLASGMIPNNVGTLAGWVQAPQAIKPGSLMPDQHLTGPQIADVTAYLETLK